MELLDELVLRHITSFLDPKDIVCLHRTCRRMHTMLPEVVVTEYQWKGENFHIFGPRGGHWAPEHYFDGPVLPGNAIKLESSVLWEDQGFGNRKGELFVHSMRPSRTGKPLQIAEHRQLFGIAEHYEKTAHKVLGREDPIIAKSRKGDFYRFMRNAGGGGGHQLKVKNFRVKATLCEVKN